jgi:hypothetical protein
MKIVKKTTLADVRAAKPKMIYYGFRTTWWTHDPKHLYAIEKGRVLHPSQVTPTSIPCDPRGGVLLQTDDIEGFISMSEANTEHFGKHGIDAFIGAHHDNCQTDFGMPWSADTFEQIGEAIDRQEKEADRA